MRRPGARLAGATAAARSATRLRRGARARIGCLAAAAAAAAALSAPGAAQALPDHFYGAVQQGPLVDQDYDRMAQANLGILRMQLSWPTVQADKGRCQASAQVGVCDWRHLDALVGNAAVRGVQVLPYFLNVPRFVARDPDTPPVRSKQARRAWTNFISAAVKRYGPGGLYWWAYYPFDHPGSAAVPIEHWQIWNEPSAAPFWHPKPKPREYGRLVKLTSKAIRDADPKAYVVLAGLFGTPVTEIGGIIQPEFLRKLYKTRGIERFFDAVAIHPYGPDLKRVRFQVKWALAEMRRARDRNADLWISEIGWASDRLHNQLGVGRKGQAKMLKRSFRMFKRMRSKWNVESVNWYAWQDTDAEGYCDFCRRSGLVNVAREPKPSFDAFRELAGP